MLFCTYLLITNRRKRFIRDKYLRIKLCCFFIAFWPPMPKVTLVLPWRWCKIFQQDMSSLSGMFWNNGRCVPLNHKHWYSFVDKSMQNKSIELWYNLNNAWYWNSKCKARWFTWFNLFQSSWKIIQVRFYIKIKSNH